jgi:hypothetical protein
MLGVNVSMTDADQGQGITVPLTPATTGKFALASDDNIWHLAATGITTTEIIQGMVPPKVATFAAQQTASFSSKNHGGVS